jgi:hypothetical protein
MTVKKDFRARLQAKPGDAVKKRIYGPKNQKTNVCAPLWDTNGLLIPYTPAIQVTHTAVEYSQYSLPQTNFDYFAFAKRSSPMLSVTAMFTAQNQKEARYLLACLHFLRAVTMNYYGRQNGDLRGINPPTLLFSAYGPYMYHKVPMLIRNVSFGLDQDVDYISCHDEGDVVHPNDYNPDMEFHGLTKEGAGEGQMHGNEFAMPDSAPDGTPWSRDDGAVSNLEKRIAQSYVPAVIQPFIELVYAPTPSTMRDHFNLEKFRDGQYLRGPGGREGII